MPVFCEKQGHQLRVDSLVAAEVTTEETAYQVSIYWSVISWEMDVFDFTEKAFEVCPEFLDLGGFSCTVKAFKHYKHVNGF